MTFRSALSYRYGWLGWVANVLHYEPSPIAEVLAAGAAILFAFIALLGNYRFTCWQDYLFPVASFVIGITRFLFVRTYNARVLAACVGFVATVTLIAATIRAYGFKAMIAYAILVALGEIYTVGRFSLWASNLPKEPT